MYITILKLLLSVRSFSISFFFCFYSFLFFFAVRLCISPMNFFLFRSYIYIYIYALAAELLSLHFIVLLFRCFYNICFFSYSSSYVFLVYSSSLSDQMECMGVLVFVSRCFFLHLIRSQYEQRTNARTHICHAHSRSTRSIIDNSSNACMQLLVCLH